jgi:hypothetical protein
MDIDKKGPGLIRDSTSIIGKCESIQCIERIAANKERVLCGWPLYRCMNGDY